MSIEAPWMRNLCVEHTLAWSGGEVSLLLMINIPTTCPTIFNSIISKTHEKAHRLPMLEWIQEFNFSSGVKNRNVRRSNWARRAVGGQDKIWLRGLLAKPAIRQIPEQPSHGYSGLQKDANAIHRNFGLVWR